ncbi:hypothetical protein HGB24_02630 [Candidatus Saccharibacteria bacterium]|nr:hypothetical protein [Candidatus Saccharibacteria bacterium]
MGQVVLDKGIVKSIKTMEMDRKEFLKYSGIILVGVLGLGGILKLVTNSNNQNIIPISKSSGDGGRGFGNGRYGA